MNKNKNKRKAPIKRGLFLVLGMIVCVMLLAAIKLPAMAEDDDFDVDVKSALDELAKVGEIYAEVTNNGDDFGGYVQLVIREGAYSDALMYESYVAIAAGETQTVVLSFPIPEDMNTDQQEYTLRILNKKGEELYSDRLKDLFEVTASNQFGMLCNAGASLDYFEDAINNQYLYYSNSVSDKWEGLYMMPSELTDGVTLRQMSFLIIDNYDISSCSDEEIAAIESWTKSGGVLLIGTGSNLDMCFDAFDPDFIGASLGSQMATSEYSYFSTTGYLNMADLQLDPSYSPLIYGEAYGKSAGSGYIILSTFALTDPDADSQYTGETFWNTISSIRSQSGMVTHYTLSNYQLETFYGVLQGKNSFSPGGLAVLILSYVILVGPILYLVLKKLDKREYIWLAIPAMSLLFVILVFFASRGFHMHNKQFSSIRIVSADAKEKETDYLFGYSSNAAKWSVTLEEDALTAGSLMTPNSYTFQYNADKYHEVYKASHTTSGLQLSFKPEGGFDPAYFRMRTDNTYDGEGFEYELSLDSSKLVGDFVNNSGYDLDYVLFVCDGYYDIYDDVENGDSISLNSKSRQRYSSEETLADLAKRFYDQKNYEKAKMHMALFFAAHEMNNEESFVVGVTKGDDKLIKGNIAEDTYLCIYGN